MIAVVKTTSPLPSTYNGILLRLYFVHFECSSTNHSNQSTIMSCNGCRALRLGCNENCVIRPCLEWIPSSQSQRHATLFLSKFFDRQKLIVNMLSKVPSVQQRTELFKSLLYEGVGRMVNPVHGVLGLTRTGNWHLCENAVQTVLAGGSPAPPDDGIYCIPEVYENSDRLLSTSAPARLMIENRPINAGNLREEPTLLDLFK